MEKEQAIISKLLGKFSFLEGKISVKRARRIDAEVQNGMFDSMFEGLVSTGEFTMLSAITGLDLGDAFAVIYHLAREDGIVLSLKRIVPRENAELQSITRHFHNAEIYERELIDLLGISVTGLPRGPRYPLPEGWPEGQHPLRKDWNRESLDAK